PEGHSEVTFHSYGPSPSSMPAPAKPIEPADCPDASTCFDLGDKLEKSDPKGSLAAYTRACGFAQKSGCYNAGVAWNEGRTGGKDPAKAFALFHRACELSDAAGCGNEGVDYIQGEGVAKDLARGVVLTQRACELHDANGCKN